MIENIIKITTNDRLQRSVVHFISTSSLIFSIESKSKWAPWNGAKILSDHLIKSADPVTATKERSKTGVPVEYAVVRTIKRAG